MTGLKGLAVLGAVLIAALLLITMVVSTDHLASAAEDATVAGQLASLEVDGGEKPGGEEEKRRGGGFGGSKATPWIIVALAAAGLAGIAGFGALRLRRN